MDTWYRGRYLRCDLMYLERKQGGRCEPAGVSEQRRAETSAMPRKKRPKAEGRRAVPLEPVPRAVPCGAVLVTYFGGGLAHFGWVMLVFSSVATWMGPMCSELVTPFLFSRPTATTTGTVLGTISTAGRRMHAQDPHGRELWTRVPNMAFVPEEAVGFAYVVGDSYYEGVSFVQGYAKPQAGDEVEVQYTIAEPLVARIVGMRYFEYSWTVVWVLIFPLIAVAMVSVRLASGREQIELLRHGDITYGTLTEKRQQDDSGIALLVFEFTLPLPNDQQAAVPPSAQTKAVTKGSVKTKVSASDAQHAKYRPLVYRVEHIAMETADVEDELWEPILYLPSKPSVATLVDGLVVQPTPDGRWQAPSTAICYLLGPLSVLATNLVCASNYRYD